MVKFETVLTEASGVVKAIIATFALVAALSAFYVGATAMMSIPGRLTQHDSTMIAGFKSIETSQIQRNYNLDKILCLSVADHRKLNWQLCFVNPSEVVPLDGTK